MDPIKIALAQMEVIPNQPEINLGTMLRMIKGAKEDHADLVVFPEMCIGGYLLGDTWLNDDLCKDLMEFNEDIRKSSDGIAIAFGNIYLDDGINQRIGREGWHPNKDGRTRKYNAVYVVQNGEYAQRKIESRILPKGIMPKTLLPNYRFFDDDRYFFSLEEIAQDFGNPLEKLTQPFMIEANGKMIPIGFELCEDLWCNDYRKNMESLNPTRYLIDNGAKIIVNLSASPWTYGKNAARDRRVGYLKKELGSRFRPYFYVNCTGTQNNGKNIITFDGGSTVYDKEGNPIAFAKEPYKQSLMTIDSTDKPSTQRIEEPEIAQEYDALIRGIQHVKDIMGRNDQPRYVIGLSGGIDSAVVACLLSQAVGRDKVLAVNMPTKYNSSKTKIAAAKIADNLGLTYVQVPIEGLVTVNENMLEMLDLDGSTRLSTLNKENIQAKIRGTSILSNIAAKYGAIFTNNGNKLEVALGYATLYGDVNGAIAPIADLTKTEVFEMARYLNQQIFRREVIPEILIPDALFRFREDQIAPSAELKDAQVDPMKFGYHCALLKAFTDYKKKTPEDVLRWYMEGTLSKNLRISDSLIERWGIHNPEEFITDLEWFSRTMNNAVFKRIQGPPIIVVSKSAFGYDIRESQLPFYKTREYRRLEKEVLKMYQYNSKSRKDG